MKTNLQLLSLLSAYYLPIQNLKNQSVYIAIVSYGFDKIGESFYSNFEDSIK